MKKFISLVSLFSLIASPVLSVASQPKQVVTTSITSEPPDLNSMRSTDQASFFILGHIQEGLTTRDKNGKIVGGVAEKWDVNDKGATFHLRKNAKWQDGKPVTAHDFVFAWQTVVDPNTASQYAFIMYPIKNAEAISKGEKKPSELGVVATDDHTLKVTFEKPCGYFVSLTAFATYFPVRKDFYMAQDGGKRYAADAKNILANGPFKLTLWNHGANLKIEKNEHYWDKDVVKLSMIDIPYIIIDPKARYALFKDKKVDTVGLNTETYKDAVKDSFKALRFADGSVFYIEFNHRPERVTRNVKLRQAIRSVYNTKEVVERILALPGNEATYTLFPRWLKGVKKTFRQEFPVKPHKVDIAAAKKLVEEAKKELGVAQIPPLSLLIDEGPDAKRQAEYMQAQLKKNLGIDVNIDVQTFKQRLAKMTSGDFDLVAAGWGPDYDDPMTFADLFASWNENNRGRYNNPEYDKWIREAQSTMDQTKRMNAMAKVQEIVINDVVILPQYERGLVYLQNPKLKGVIRSVVGTDPNYKYAYFE